MQPSPFAMNAALTTGAAAWPLLAGLTIVMWSKVRARRAALAYAKVWRP